MNGSSYELLFKKKKKKNKEMFYLQPVLSNMAATCGFSNLILKLIKIKQN